MKRHESARLSTEDIPTKFLAADFKHAAHMPFSEEVLGLCGIDAVREIGELSDLIDTSSAWINIDSRAGIF